MFDVGRLVAHIEMVGMQAFDRDLKQGEQRTKEFAEKAEKSGTQAAKLGEELDKTGKKSEEFGAKQKKSAADTEQAYTQVGGALTVVGTSILALTGLAVSKFAEFDAAMSKTQAVTQGTAAEQMKLRDAAIDAGSTSVFTATQAADAQTELAKAGVATADILSGGLKGSLALAAAGELEVADAAEIAATALVQFNLKGDQTSHVADLLAAGAGKAQGSVGDLSGAMKQSGLVASQMGFSVEETVGTLAAFAKNGLIGSDAGTSFRTMLLSLANPSKEAAGLLEKYNIAVYDSSGNMNTMQNLAGQLDNAFGGLEGSTRDAALATIFGSDAIRAANVLVKEGSAGIQQMTADVNDQGYAARFAAEMQNNLAGDVEKLGGAFDSALIGSGSGANDVLRDMVQLATFLVNSYNDLPVPVQQGALAFMAVAGAVALVSGAFLIGVPRVAQYKANLAILAAQGITTRGVLGGLASFVGGPWGIAFALGAAVMSQFIGRQMEVQAGAESLQSTLDATTGAFTSQTRAMIIQQLQSNGVYENAKRAGVGQKELTDAILQGGDALEAVQNKLTGANTLASFFDGTGIAAGNASEGVRRTVDALDLAQTGFENTGEAAGQSAEKTESAAAEYLAAADEVEGLSAELDALIESFDKLNGVNQDAVSTNAAYQASIVGIAADVQSQKDAYEDANNTLNGFNLSLDENTAAGSANAASLSEVAAKAQEAAAAQFEVDKTTMGAKAASDKMVGTLAASREAFVQAALKAGYNADEVQRLADKVFALPSAKQLQILADTTDAQGKMDRLAGTISLVQSRAAAGVRMSANVVGVNVMEKAHGGNVKFFAGGGENRVPQFARAGDMRVWAEPETLGEWYFPENPQHRQAGLANAQKMLAGWGYDVVQRGGGDTNTAASVRGGAGGGVTVIVKIGETELRQVARQEIDEYTTQIAVEYSGGATA